MGPKVRGRGGAGLPDGADGAGSFNGLVGGYERQAFDDGGGANDAIGGVIRIRRRQGGRAQASFGRDRENAESRFDLLEEDFKAGLQLNPVLFREHGQFEHGDVADGQCFAARSRSIDAGVCAGRNLLRLKREPCGHMRIQENQARLPQSFGGRGETISPVIEPRPFMKPKMSSVSFSMGESFAIGLPRLVMTMVSRLAWTSSMMAKQRALNSPAGIFLAFTDARDYGHSIVVIYNCGVAPP